MNNNLISREDLNKTIDGITWYHINPHGELTEGAFDDGDALYKAEDIYNAIDNAPTVEPHYVSDLPDDVVKTLQTLAIDYSDGIAVFERKRPQGEWICHSDSYITFYTCNRCNGFGYKDDKFCNNCGAKMQEGVE